MEYVREHRFTQLANVCAGDPEVGRWNQCMLTPLVNSAKQVAQKVYIEACNRGRRDASGLPIARLERFAYHSLRSFVRQATPLR